MGRGGGGATETPELRVERVLILLSELYQSIKHNDPERYETYKALAESTGHLVSQPSWDEYLSLQEKIRVEGFGIDVFPPITTTHTLGQLDGAHRLAILCHLRSPDAPVVQVDGEIYPFRQDLTLRTKKHLKKFSSSGGIEALEVATRRTRVMIRLGSKEPAGNLFRNIFLQNYPSGRDFFDFTEL